MPTYSQNFIRRLNNIVRELDGHISLFKEVFTPKEIEQFLFDVVNIMSDCRYSAIGQTIIGLVAHDVKDVPELGEDGRPSSNRCTPLHKAINKVKEFRDSIIQDLFMIYDRFDVNYTDVFGLTHLHVACIAGCYDAVEKFLEHDHDHNCRWSLTGDSPLHLALKYRHDDIAMMLLLQDYDPNLANDEGLTALHYICRGYNFTGSDMAEVFLLINEEKQRRVEIDARDNERNTPLHLALACGNSKEPEVLLRRGADPTLINAEGSTCLHIICNFKYDDYGLAKLFFKIIDDLKLVMEIEAQDRSRQTPLQLALKNFLPVAAEALLEHGAVFPGYDFLTSHLAEKLNSNEDTSCNYKLRLACGVVGLIESLEKQGYELDDGNALTIMRLFDEHRLIKRSETFNKDWHNGNDFEAKAQWWCVTADFNSDNIEQNLWLNKLVKKRPEEAAKLLTYRDWVKFAGPTRPWQNLAEKYHEPLVMHMCEIMARRFFRKWALCCFWDLIAKRLPIECCDLIIDDDFTNEDLLNICLAASTPTNDALQSNESNDASVRNESNDA